MRALDMGQLSEEIGTEPGGRGSQGRQRGDGERDKGRKKGKQGSGGEETRVRLGALGGW